MAALERADLELHSVVDERSAAYVALGLARATGQPVALLCTSGTATANYFPAIVEARLTHIPLIVLTADRPLSMQGCAAPQTIDQAHIYGRHVVAAATLTIPDGSDEELLHVRRQVLAVVAQAQGVERGPVHLNLHTPKPLELLHAESPRELEFQGQVDALISRTEPLLRARPAQLDERGIERIHSSVGAEPRGVITCGFDADPNGLDTRRLARFARATGYPVLVDAAHPLRCNCGADLRPHLVAPFEPLLRSAEWRSNQAPKLVVQIGRPLTSAVWERWLADPEPHQGIERIVLLTSSGWPDPGGRAELLGMGDPNDTLDRVSSLLESGPMRATPWGERWLRAGDIVRQCVDAWAVHNNDNDLDTWGELRAVAATLRSQPEGARIVVGNSLPVRELDFLAPTLPIALHLEALRGASGIDGVVSTAVGFALANDRPTTLLVGDVSFLHDVGSLWAARSVRSPLAIVVLNNGGGRIFEQLPIAQSVSPERLAYWTTPHSLDLSAAARLYDLRYRRAESSEALSECITEAYACASTTLIEVPLPADSAKRETSEIAAVVSRALRHAGLLEPLPSE